MKKIKFKTRQKVTFTNVLNHCANLNAQIACIKYFCIGKIVHALPGRIVNFSSDDLDNIMSRLDKVERMINEILDMYETNDITF